MQSVQIRIVADSRAAVERAMLIIDRISGANFYPGTIQKGDRGGEFLGYGRLEMRDPRSDVTSLDAIAKQKKED